MKADIVVINVVKEAPVSITFNIVGAMYKLIKFNATPNNTKRSTINMTFFSFFFHASLIINHEF